MVCDGGGKASERCAMRLFPIRRRLSNGPGTKLPQRLLVLEPRTNRCHSRRRISSQTHIDSKDIGPRRCTALWQARDRGSIDYRKGYFISFVVHDGGREMGTEIPASEGTDSGCVVSSSHGSRLCYIEKTLGDGDGDKDTAPSSFGYSRNWRLN